MDYPLEFSHPVASAIMRTTGHPQKVMPVYLSRPAQ
jgi:hypothetical protein